MDEWTVLKYVKWMRLRAAKWCKGINYLFSSEHTGKRLRPASAIVYTFNDGSKNAFLISS